MPCVRSSSAETRNGGGHRPAGSCTAEGIVGHGHAAVLLKMTGCPHSDSPARKRDARSQDIGRSAGPPDAVVSSGAQIRVHVIMRCRCVRPNYPPPGAWAEFARRLTTRPPRPAHPAVAHLPDAPRLVKGHPGDNAGWLWPLTPAAAVRTSSIDCGECRPGALGISPHQEPRRCISRVPSFGVCAPLKPKR